MDTRKYISTQVGKYVHKYSTSMSSWSLGLAIPGLAVLVNSALCQRLLQKADCAATGTSSKFSTLEDII